MKIKIPSFIQKIAATIEFTAPLTFPNGPKKESVTTAATLLQKDHITKRDVKALRADLLGLRAAEEAQSPLYALVLYNLLTSLAFLSPVNKKCPFGGGHVRDEGVSPFYFCSGHWTDLKKLNLHYLSTNKPLTHPFLKENLSSLELEEFLRAHSIMDFKVIDITRKYYGKPIIRNMCQSAKWYGYSLLSALVLSSFMVTGWLTEMNFKKVDNVFFKLARTVLSPPTRELINLLHLSFHLTLDLKRYWQFTRIARELSTPQIHFRKYLISQSETTISTELAASPVHSNPALALVLSQIKMDVQRTKISDPSHIIPQVIIRTIQALESPKKVTATTVQRLRSSLQMLSNEPGSNLIIRKTLYNLLVSLAFAYPINEDCPIAFTPFEEGLIPFYFASGHRVDIRCLSQAYANSDRFHFNPSTNTELDGEDGAAYAITKEVDHLGSLPHYLQDKKLKKLEPFCVGTVFISFLGWGPLALIFIMRIVSDRNKKTDDLWLKFLQNFTEQPCPRPQSESELAEAFWAQLVNTGAQPTITQSISDAIEATSPLFLLLLLAIPVLLTSCMLYTNKNFKEKMQKKRLPPQAYFLQWHKDQQHRQVPDHSEAKEEAPQPG